MGSRAVDSATAALVVAGADIKLDCWKQPRALPASLRRVRQEELEASRAQGKIHDHAALKTKFQKESDYRRYLLFHHCPPQEKLN